MLQYRNHLVVVFRLMRKGTVRTYLDGFSILFHIGRIPGTCRQLIHRTVTEQTVKVRSALITRGIFTVFIFKKAI